MKTSETTEEVSSHVMEKRVERRKWQQNTPCATRKTEANRKRTCKSVERQEHHEKGPRWSWAKKPYGKCRWNALPILSGRKGGRTAGGAAKLVAAIGRAPGRLGLDQRRRRLRPEPDWFQQQRGYTPNPHPGQLFNLRDDLPERSNLYAEQPAKVGELTALLEKYKTDGHSTPARP